MVELGDFHKPSLCRHTDGILTCSFGADLAGGFLIMAELYNGLIGAHGRLRAGFRHW
jgi:hypothetical protein